MQYIADNRYYSTDSDKTLLNRMFEPCKSTCENNQTV